MEARFAAIEATSQGRLGVAVITRNGRHFRRENEKFSLQSVMKMVVAMAALDLVDQGKWKRDQRFVFRRSDLSLSHQPIKEKLGNKAAVNVTLSECIHLMVTESCSGAADFIIRKMGGTEVVNAFLKKNKIVGMSVDREERYLQTNVVGLTWKQKYVESRKLDRDIAKQSVAAKDAAYKRYQQDPRDTTTPAAMADLLQKLISVQLLSGSSTTYLMGVMEQTITGQNRLKAGVPASWTLGHKTGTSSSNRGVTHATNDVGFARNQSGDWVIIVALLRASTLNSEGRDAVLKEVAAAAFSR
jgi:beta-lactamase class A